MKKPSIFIIGDSISISYGSYLHKYLKDKFRYCRKKGTKEAFWNFDLPIGANGGDSSLVLKYILNNYIHREIPDVDYFLFNCGLHDIKTSFFLRRKQVSLKKYRKNLCLILKEANKFAKHIVWINSTPIDDVRHNSRCGKFFRHNKDVLLYNSAAKKIMQKHGIPIIDLYLFTRKCGQNLYIDHVHFNERICRKQGKYIGDFLLEKLNLS